jgi:two-component system sensor histidine kinase KdpD
MPDNLPASNQLFQFQPLDHQKGDDTTPLSVARSLLVATIACAVTTAAAAWLLRVFDLSNVVMLFLVTVVFVALKLGRVAGAFASLLCVASFDFFFVDPRFSFAVSDTQYLFTFALMLIVALIISQLAAQLQSKARLAIAGERRASALARVASDLAAAMDTKQIDAICRNAIAPMFQAHAALLLPDPHGKLRPETDGEPVDYSDAQWLFDGQRQANFATPSVGAKGTLYLPLTASEGIRGVLALQPQGGPLPNQPDDRRLLLACSSSVAMALERTHFVTVAQDTQVRMAGERLRNALLSAVSHDLKTPLTAIRGLAETLEQPDRLSREEQCDLARSIRLQSEELHRFVVNFLDLARMQNEGMRLNSDWHLLSEVIGSALSRAVPAVREHRVKIEAPADLPLIRIDAAMFERVLINLLDNAAKYTPAGRTIRLRAGSGDGWMTILVEDDGPGLPAGDSEELFVPFSRGRAESAVPGVGLGLSLCRTIVTAHGGTIHAVPSALGGAAFEIRLPLGQPPAIALEDDQ